MSKILITGGAGFFGSHLTEIFLKKGYDVNIIDDFSTGKRANIRNLLNSKKLKIFNGSIGNKKVLNKAISGCEGVIHCATKNVRFSIKNPVKTHKINSQYTLQLFEVAFKKKIKKFIYCSSSEIYGNCNTKNKKLNEFEIFDPSTIYGATKLAGEYYAKVYRDLYNLNIITIRPFNLYGERAHLTGNSAEVITRFFLNIMKKNTLYIYGKGNNSRDFTYVKDAAEIFLKVYETKNRFKTPVVNLGTGKNFSIIQIKNLISKILKAKNLTIKYMGKRPGDVKNLICDNKKLKKNFNTYPKTKFVIGLKKFYFWLVTKKNTPKVKKINW